MAMTVGITLSLKPEDYIEDSTREILMTYWVFRSFKSLADIQKLALTDKVLNERDSFSREQLCIL